MKKFLLLRLRRISAPKHIRRLPERKFLGASIFLSLLFVIITGISFAQEENPQTPSPTKEVKAGEIKEELKDKIADLKERLATRVAEIKAQNKKAFYGEIIEKDESTFLLQNEDEKMTIVFDDLTVFKKSSDQGYAEIAVSSLNLKDKITAFGHLDIDQKTLVAKTIIFRKLPLMFNGRALELNVNDGTIKIETFDNKEFVFDYEIRSKCLLWNHDDNKTTSCGLSKIKEGDFVFIKALEQKNSENLTILHILAVPLISESEME